jgi:hypothetical protein
LNDLEQVEKYRSTVRSQKNNKVRGISEKQVKESSNKYENFYL